VAGSVVGRLPEDAPDRKQAARDFYHLGELYRDAGMPLDDLSSLREKKEWTKAMIGLRDLLRRAVFTEFRTGIAWIRRRERLSSRP